MATLSAMKKTMIIVCAIMAFSACGNLTGPVGPVGPAGPAGSATKVWSHVITDEETTFISGSPYGYYVVTIFDDWLSGDPWTPWLDLVAVADTGAWYRQPPTWDEPIGIWYGVIYQYDGSVEYFVPYDVAGTTIVLCVWESL